MIQPLVRSGRGVWDAPELPSSGRTSPMGLAGTDGDRTRVMLQLDQVAAGLQVRPYFHRYTEDALDLCDVFDSYTPGAKIKPHEICKIIGLRGKPSGIDGSDVEAMVAVRLTARFRRPRLQVSA